MTSDIMNFKAKHQRTAIQKFKSLDVLEEDSLLCVLRASLKDFGGHSEWRLGDF